MRLRIFNRHTHYWVDTGILEQGWPDPHVRYECSVCQKQIIRRASKRPINPLVPSAWEVYNQEVARGNAHLVMQPQMLPNESDFTEGERYAALIKGSKL
jgi:hypothetical protein